jgi:membrane dipeptidase
VREREKGLKDRAGRGRGVVTLGEMRKGHIGLCVATQIGHYVAKDNPLAGWASPEIAWAVTQGQLAWYRAMEERGEMAMVRDLASLDRQLALWKDPEQAVKNNAPVGYVLSLEGGDSILTMKHLERAYEYGLRAIGPAHYSTGRYAPGTGAEGPLTAAGRELVKEMDRLGIILDCTHLTDEGFFEALEIHHGVCWASHQNCRSLVPHQRQFSDDQIKALIARDALCGMAFDAWMMVPDWVRGRTTPQDSGVKIDWIVKHIDHICQLAGNARHVGIGSDLDGGYGTEQTPGDMDSISDLQRIAGMLRERGYPEKDVEAIFSGNWLRLLRKAWSK